MEIKDKINNIFNNELKWLKEFLMKTGTILAGYSLYEFIFENKEIKLELYTNNDKIDKLEKELKECLRLREKCNYWCNIEIGFNKNKKEKYTMFESELIDYYNIKINCKHDLKYEFTLYITKEAPKYFMITYFEFDFEKISYDGFSLYIYNEKSLINKTSHNNYFYQTEEMCPSSRYELFFENLDNIIKFVNKGYLILPSDVYDENYEINERYYTGEINTQGVICKNEYYIYQTIFPYLEKKLVERLRKELNIEYNGTYLEDKLPNHSFFYREKLKLLL
jgi:hypothetical protein